MSVAPNSRWRPYKQMARISITPNWARFYDFGAGRVPDFLTRLP
jgi:hypothetical protein